MRHLLAALAAAGLCAAAGCAGSSGTATSAGSTPAAGSTSPSPAPSPSASGQGWVRVVDNPWLPLTPGSKWVYRGVEGGEPTRDVMTIDQHTKLISGIHATIAHDNLYSGSGRLLERTDDWYAQDSAGNVWYMGEATAELDKSGAVKTTEGSWEDGRNGAHAGIIMYADPRVGTSYAQENFPNHAEDHAKVLSLNASVHVPAAHSSAALETKEWTPLEPDIVEHKYYIRGIGDTYDTVVAGPTEYSKLVSFTPGS